MGFLDRLRQGLARTTQQLVSRFQEIAGRADAPEGRGQLPDADTLESLEELLISADVGVGASERIVRAVGERRRAGQAGSLRDVVKEEILAILESAESGTQDAPSGRARLAGEPPPGPPCRVILVVGVNGTGKTTT